MTREQFVSDLSQWNSYLPVLWYALESTGYSSVIELGVGDGSTDKLSEYCFDNNRQLYSYESNLEWYNKFEVHNGTPFHEMIYVGDNWQILHEQQCHNKNIGVLFSDEAPGEMRKYNISMFCNIAQVIVAHDSENDHGYKFSLVEPLFKYVKKFEYQGVGTTAFSNFIDVTQWP